jgi:integrase
MPTEITQLSPERPLSTERNVVALQHASAIADQIAGRNAFSDYMNRKAINTTTAQRADLARFAEYLGAVGIATPPDADMLQGEPSAWQYVTWGIVEGFVKWQLHEGHAIASINRRLSTIKNYAKLATKAGVMSAEQLALIKTVTGYGKTEAKRIDIKRNVTRVGEKKATAVRLSVEQANQLKQQPNTPQGRRDALLICLLLDHGLRVGEVALLQAEQFDRLRGQFRFERPKVDGTQTHKLTADTLRAFYAWVNAGDCPPKGPLLRESLKNGELTEPGMSERAIKARVRLLGERIGVFGLSPHDCRHYWATYWSDKVNILRLQEAGGWASLEMPRRYVERAKIANEGMA